MEPVPDDMAQPVTTAPGAAKSAPGLGPWRSAALPAGFRAFPPAALDASVGARFLAVAEEFGDREALSSPAGTWTYAELSLAARTAAAAIAAAVDRPEPTPVGLLVTHDGPLVVAILGVVLAGHVVVVLDPSAPAESTAHVLQECSPALLVHDEANRDLVAALALGATHAVPFDELTGTPEPMDAAAIPHRGPDDAFMLAFTSGTSGGSKGGVITHGVLMNLVRGATDALGIGPDDRMPMLFPTSLAVAAYPMFLPLLNGGALATLDVRSVGLAPVADFLSEERITLAYMAPTVVRFLVDALAGRTFPHLRMIALGGELVDAEVVRITADLFRPELIANGFGTTETGVITLYVMDPSEAPEGAVPAGYPVPEVELMVIDDHGLPVPDGEAGEVAVASPHVFAGYWGHPELSAQVLRPDPQGRPGWQLYRTGDLGRLDQHGALTVLGRLDTKVKVRGRFVVLGDVEADLHELDGVADAAVVARRDGAITELVAVIAPAPDAEVDGPTLRASLLEGNEAYRVPTRWTVVESLPRLPNGKLDRQALVDATVDATAGTSPTASPSAADPATTPVTSTPASIPGRGHQSIEARQRELRDLWELLLPGTVVGLDDDFAHLGGDSLLAAQMLVLLEQRTGVTVPMGELIHAHTVRELAAVVDAIASADDTHPSTVSCVQAGDETTRPRLWFVHDLQGSAYRVRHVAEGLGADQPVWSFESPLLRGEPNPFRQLDTFAAAYVRDMREAQPEGPYWLAGYSFGGICAYEMARQLRRDGQEVAFVGVIDVGPGYRGPGWGDGHPPLRPWFGIAQPPPAGAGLRELIRHYRAMWRHSPKGTVRHLTVRSGAARRIDPLRFRADLRRTGRVRPEWRLWYAWEEHWNLASQHWERSNDYAGPVDLFWAADTPSADATMGWGDLVGRLHIHRFEGDHVGVLEPGGAAALALSLRSVLDTAIAPTPPAVIDHDHDHDGPT